MKLLILLLALLCFISGGCASRRQAVDFKTDRYTYEALERRFGKLAATSDHSGFSSVGEYGIWKRIYIKTTTTKDGLYRIDYINLRHHEGTSFSAWRRGIEDFFKVDVDVERLSYYSEPYNGWRVELSTSNNLIHTIFCWMEDKDHKDLDVTLDGKITWEWGRVVFKEYHNEAKERREKEQKELREKQKAQQGDQGRNAASD